MKNIAAILNVCLALSVGASGFALGQEHRNGPERGGGRPEGKDGGNGRNGDDEGRGPGGARPGPPERRGPPQWRQAQDGDRGAGPRQAFHRGDRLPRAEHQQRYVVNDWRARRLSPPPRGYHWVQTGDDYVLVAIASGIILQLLLRN